jgi:hypothetical protein
MGKVFRFKFIKNFMGFEKEENINKWFIKFKKKKKDRRYYGHSFKKKYPIHPYSGTYRTLTQRHYLLRAMLTVFGMLYFYISLLFRVCFSLLCPNGHNKTKRMCEGHMIKKKMKKTIIGSRWRSLDGRNKERW